MIKRSLSELAEYVQGRVIGDGSVSICGVNSIERACQGDLTFVAGMNSTDLLAQSQASAALVRCEPTDWSCPCIIVDQPTLAFSRIHALFLQKDFLSTGVSERAVVGEDCTISQEVSIGPLCVVGNRVNIGHRVTMYPGVVIGDDVIIGDDTTLHANVSVYTGCSIGDRVIIHSGTVVGSDGFGYISDENGNHVKRPHVGTVRIDDDVEIGSNVCVDRATFGETRIHSGVKIDNLVQVAHNVDIGENSLLVAQCGIAGSSSLGRNVVLGGQVGVAGHIHLADHVMVGAQSGVHNSQPRDTVISGTPAFSHQKWLRASLAVAKLPEIIKDIRVLKKQLSCFNKEKKEDEND